ncbi:hypothetical protein VZT92_009084 [Zoarces viviparus]|uniref:Uncharacterized protein n=1 Tax=Zoarces viviparus TaxID=48416 RepID=A0AAW1FH09_ZOAVI
MRARAESRNSKSAVEEEALESGGGGGEREQISAAVWFLAAELREKEALCICPSIALWLPAPPPLSCLTPFTVFTSSFPSSICFGLGEGRGRCLQAAQCGGGVNPLIACHYPCGTSPH